MHPLDGPRLKIGRAKSKIDFLRIDQDTFRRQSQYQIIRSELNAKTGKYVYRARTQGITPSFDWVLEIGEVAHNLRSALDGLTCRLVELAGNTPTRRTQFPICLTGRGRAKKPAFRIQRKDRLQGIRPKHQAMIERLQPYKRGRKGKLDALWILQKLNNIDKHQAALTVGVKPSGIAFSSRTSQKPRINIRKFVVLKDGAKILEAPAYMHVNSKLVPLVAFGDGCPKEVIGVGVLYILGRIRVRVSNAVESFASEFPT